jgi:hypothetical protein
MSKEPEMSNLRNLKRQTFTLLWLGISDSFGAP